MVEFYHLQDFLLLLRERGFPKFLALPCFAQVFFFFFSLRCFIEVCLILNVMLISSVQQSDSVIHIYGCCWCSSLSHIQLFSTPQTVDRQAPLSMQCSRQEYWSEQPFPSPGIFPTWVSYSYVGRQVLYHQRHLGSPIYIYCVCVCYFSFSFLLWFITGC